MSAISHLALRQTSQFRMEELKGYLWPAQVYERVKKTKIPKTMTVTTITYQGRQVRGVVLDESHGRPAGTIALYSEDTRFIRKDWFTSHI